jgi:hypothetical protein
MIWTAITMNRMDGGTHNVVFTAAWDRTRALARFRTDYPDLQVVALLAGDHADNIYTPSLTN